MKKQDKMKEIERKLPKLWRKLVVVEEFTGCWLWMGKYNFKEVKEYYSVNSNFREKLLSRCSLNTNCVHPLHGKNTLKVGISGV